MVWGLFVLIGLATLVNLQPTNESLFAARLLRAQVALLAGAKHMYSNFIKLALTGTMLCSAATTMANAQAASSPNSDIRSAYIESYGQNQNGSVLQVLASLFQQFDRSGDGIDAVDIELFEKQQLAQMHAGTASQWLRMDLNADLKVSREEIENSMDRYRRRPGVMTEQQSKRMSAELNKQVDALSSADADGNGAIEGPELYTPQHKGRDETAYFSKATAFVKALLKADPNGDGKLIETEAALISSQALEGVDAQISQELVQRQMAHSGGMSADCPKLDVSKNSTLVLLGAYEGTSLSTVTVAGQDQTTHGATLFIEDGASPITLVVTGAGPMIWQLKGATKRVDKMIVAGPTDRQTNEKISAGVAGIERSKIQFVKATECLHYFSDAKSTDALMTNAYLQKMTGKAPDVFLGKYEMGVVAIPSGRGAPQEVDATELAALKAKAGVKFYTVGPDGKLATIVETRGDQALPFTERDLFEYNPDGLMDFKATDVVSEAKAEAYNVFPEHAGLLQLAGQDKFEWIGGDRGSWKIKSSTHFPAGLYGAHATSFFLPKGVSMPEGNPGHSKVFSEESASYIDFN
jgi:hypothetical protein